MTPTSFTPNKSYWHPKHSVDPYSFFHDCGTWRWNNAATHRMNQKVNKLSGLFNGFLIDCTCSMKGELKYVLVKFLWISTIWSSINMKFIGNFIGIHNVFHGTNIDKAGAIGFYNNYQVLLSSSCICLSDGSYGKFICVSNCLVTSLRWWIINHHHQLKC